VNVRSARPPLDGGDEIADSLGPLQPHGVIQEVVELGYGL